MTRVDVLHYIGATAKSLSVVASVVRDLRDRDDEVRVLDIGDTTYISQDYPPPWICRLLGHRVKVNAFEDEVTRLGATYLRSFPTDGSGDISPAQQTALDQAIQSEILTYFRANAIPASRAARDMKKSLEANALKTFQSLHQLWSAEPPERVLIPNGRTSRQKAARLVAEMLGIKVKLYENGRARPRSYYLGSTQPHDRLASQAEVSVVTKGLSDEACHGLAREWLSNRMGSGSQINPFQGGWNSEIYSPAPGRKTAVFFASSVDEFLAFGPMWTIDSWTTQFEAFDLIMSILEERDIDLVLRLHPNLGSKSRSYVRQTMDEVERLRTKHPRLKVFPHHSPVNSYELVKSADLVIVERSTIGLEASLLGKPVWVTQASQWDLVADVRQLLEPSDVTEDQMTPWIPDPSGAERFVSYWMVQEHPLHYSWDTWSSWDPDRAPLRMKLARLAVKNPWRHRRHLVALEWARWRNSGPTSSKKSSPKG